MILNAGRIRTIQDETGRQYIGKSVYEAQPNGEQWEAVIHIIEWEHSIGQHGDWNIHIVYVNHPTGIIGHWCSRDVLTLKDGE